MTHQPSLSHTIRQNQRETATIRRSPFGFKSKTKAEEEEPSPSITPEPPQVPETPPETQTQTEPTPQRSPKKKRPLAPKKQKEERTQVASRPQDSTRTPPIDPEVFKSNDREELNNSVQEWMNENQGELRSYFDLTRDDPNSYARMMSIVIRDAYAQQNPDWPRDWLESLRGAAYSQLLLDNSERVGRFRNDYSVKGWSQKIFGEKLTENQMIDRAAPLIGAYGLEDTAVDIIRSDNEGVTFETYHPSLNGCKNTLRVDAQGNPFVHLDYISVVEKGQGIAPRIILSQLEALRKQKMYLTAMATSVYYPPAFNTDLPHGGFKMNGGQVWPLMGGNIEINKMPKALIKAVRSHKRDAKTLMEVIAAPGGDRYWKFLMDQLIGYNKTADGYAKLQLNLRWNPADDMTMQLARIYTESAIERGKRRGKKSMDISSNKDDELYADPGVTDEQLEEILDIMEEKRKTAFEKKSYGLNPTELTPSLYTALDKVGEEEPKQLIQLPDVRQRNDFECGMSITLSVLKYWNVGEHDPDKLSKILDTNRKTSTHPYAIRDYLKSLGLQVEDKDHMTLEDLKDYWEKGIPVICPIQEYGDPVEDEKHEDQKHKGPKAEFPYGHYVASVGVGMGQVFVQDPSIDNVLSGEHADATKGKMIIPAMEFLKVWHDKDKEGNEFVRYGIAVGPPVKGEKGQVIGSDTYMDIATTPRSGGPITGTPPPTDLKRPLWYGTGSGTDSYEFDSPQNRVKDLSKKPHEFSSTQFDLKDCGYSRSVGSPIPRIKKIQDSIADEDLTGDGREDKLHITVLYGLHTDDVGDVKRVVKEWIKSRSRGGITVKLGDVSIFPANDKNAQRGGDYQDVLKLDVESNDLHDLHNFLAENLEHTDTHPEYHPHLTLAYLVPGNYFRYVGEGLGGQEVICTHLVFSNKSREKTVIDLYELSKESETKALKRSNEEGWRCESNQCEWSLFQAGDDGMDMEKPGGLTTIHDQEPWQRAMDDRFDKDEVEIGAMDLVKPSPYQQKGFSKPGLGNDYVFYRQSYDRWRTKPDVLGDRRVRSGWERGFPSDQLAIRNDEEFRLKHDNKTKESQLWHATHPEDLPEEAGLTPGKELEEDDKSPRCPDGSAINPATRTCAGHMNKRGGYPGVDETHLESDDVHVGGQLAGDVGSRTKVIRPSPFGKRKAIQEEGSESNKLKEQSSSEPVSMQSVYTQKCPNGDPFPIGSGSCQGRQANSYDGLVDNDNLAPWGSYPDIAPVTGLDTRDPKDKEKPVVGPAAVVYAEAHKDIPTCPAGEEMPPNVRSCGGDEGWKAWELTCPDGTPMSPDTRNCSGREGFIPFTEEERRQETLFEPPKPGLQEIPSEGPLKARYPTEEETIPPAGIRHSPFGKKDLDRQGGEIPPLEEMSAAEKYDFITLPEDVSGTNCLNCTFAREKASGHICGHPKLLGLPVNEHNCCALWDNREALRAWENEKESKAYNYEDEVFHPEQDNYQSLEAVDSSKEDSEFNSQEWMGKVLEVEWTKDLSEEKESLTQKTPETAPEPPPVQESPDAQESAQQAKPVEVKPAKAPKTPSSQPTQSRSVSSGYDDFVSSLESFLDPDTPKPSWDDIKNKVWGLSNKEVLDLWQRLTGEPYDSLTFETPHYTDFADKIYEIRQNLKAEKFRQESIKPNSEWSDQVTAFWTYMIEHDQESKADILRRTLDGSQAIRDFLDRLSFEGGTVDYNLIIPARLSLPTILDDLVEVDYESESNSVVTDALNKANNLNDLHHVALRVAPRAFYLTIPDWDKYQRTLFGVGKDVIQITPKPIPKDKLWRQPQPGDFWYLRDKEGEIKLIAQVRENKDTGDAWSTVLDLRREGKHRDDEITSYRAGYMEGSGVDLEPVDIANKWLYDLGRRDSLEGRPPAASALGIEQSAEERALLWSDPTSFPIEIFMDDIRDKLRKRTYSDIYRKVKTNRYSGRHWTSMKEYEMERPFVVSLFHIIGQKWDDQLLKEPYLGRDHLPKIFDEVLDEYFPPGGAFKDSLKKLQEVFPDDSNLEAHNYFNHDVVLFDDYVTHLAQDFISEVSASHFDESGIAVRSGLDKLVEEYNTNPVRLVKLSKIGELDSLLNNNEWEVVFDKFVRKISKSNKEKDTPRVLVLVPEILLRTIYLLHKRRSKTKALSWLGSGSGGDLVAPAEFRGIRPKKKLTRQSGEVRAQLGPGHPTSSSFQEPDSDWNLDPLSIVSSNKMMDRSLSCLVRAKALPPLEHGHQPTLAVDVDGTLCNTPPHQGPPPSMSEMEPRPGAVEAMNHFHNIGWRIILWTVRDDLNEIWDWARRHRIPVDFINENPDQPTTSPKIIADHYIDDRSLAPTDWEEVVREVDSSRARQPVPSDIGYNKLAEWGEQVLPELEELLSPLGFPVVQLSDLDSYISKPGGLSVIAPIKAQPRAEEKVESDYDGDWSQLLDMVRATVAVDSLEDLIDVFSTMKDLGVIPIRKPKNRFKNPLPNGYRDYQINVKLPSGMICEIQFHLKKILASREREKLSYDVIRAIRAALKEEGRDSMTSGEAAAVQRARDSAIRLFEGAWQECMDKEKRTKQLPFGPTPQAPKVPPSPFQDEHWHKSVVQYQVKADAPFTGERVDVTGRHYCYAGGVKVPCSKEEADEQDPTRPDSQTASLYEMAQAPSPAHPKPRTTEIEESKENERQVYAVIFNSDGNLLVRDDDPWGGFVWTGEKKNIKDQLEKLTGLDLKGVSTIGDNPGEGKGYFVFQAGEKPGIGSYNSNRKTSSTQV